MTSTKLNSFPIKAVSPRTHHKSQIYRPSTMKTFQINTIIFVLAIASTFASKDEDDAWEEYKRKHGKNHKEEEAKRKELFVRVHRRIKEHNESGSPWKVDHNKFSDWTPEEKKQLTGKRVVQERVFKEKPGSYDSYVTDRQLPPSLDYRNDTCLGPVKNQGYCGSCWAFSSIVPLEFQLCKSQKSYTALSEQQLVNCACSGCNGGDYYPAWQYLSGTASGSVASTTLLYQAKEGRCKRLSDGWVKPSYWMRLPVEVPAIVRALIDYGPLAASMHVNDSFISYKSGVFDASDCSSKYLDLNHAINIVGYGTDATTGLDYWVVRNSWGTEWGEAGYIRVRSGVNRCGIETDVGYVTSVSRSPYWG